MPIRMKAKDARQLLARNATGATTVTSMAAWVDGCLILELPHPPSGNRRTTHYRGRTISTREWREYKDSVLAVCQGTPSPLMWCSMMRTRLETEIDWYPPDKRVRDIDNVIKACLDSITHGMVWRDDSQVDLLTIRRMPVEPGGKVVVRIRERA